MLQNQSPRLIDWAVTPRCNLNCRHCRGMAEGELSSERARRLVTEIAALKPGWVIIEGGEALLRDDLFELLELMRQQGLEVHLITNGTLFTPRILAALKKLGVKVMISIDGATRQTYEAIRSGARFSEVLQAIRECSQEGLLEALNFTIMKSNYAEIPGIFELAKSTGTPLVTLIGLKPCTGYAEELLTPEEYRETIHLVCQGAQQTGVEFFVDEPFFWATVQEEGLFARLPESGAGIVAPSTTACIFGEYLYIETNGDVKPCSFAPMVIDNVRAWERYGAGCSPRPSSRTSKTRRPAPATAGNASTWQGAKAAAPGHLCSAETGLPPTPAAP